MSRITAFIQARMSSKRLPGKALKILLDKPLIEYLFEQVKLVKDIGQIVLLTSDESSDDVLGAVALNNGIELFRGSIVNVAERFKKAVDFYSPEYFIRLNADSPLYHHQIIEKGIVALEASNADFVTNALHRTYPRGMGFELLKSAIYLENYGKFTSKDDFEHVLSYFYRHSENFKICNFENDEDLSQLHFAVDTQEDFNRVERLFLAMRKPHTQHSWSEYLQLFKRFGGDPEN